MFFDLLINAFLLLLITILAFVRAKWKGIGTCYGYCSNLLVSCHYTSCSHGAFFSITKRFLSFLSLIILRIDSNLMNIYTNFSLALTFNCFSIFFSIFLLHLRILYGEEEKIQWLPLVSFDDQFLVRIFKRESKKKKVKETATFCKKGKKKRKNTEKNCWTVGKNEKKQKKIRNQENRV